MLGPTEQAVLVEQHQEIGRGHDQGRRERSPEAVDRQVEASHPARRRRAPAARPPERTGRSRASWASAGEEQPQEPLIDAASAPRCRPPHTCSSAWCMVVPTRPNSTTGQWRGKKRASDVPPVVLSFGRSPVSASMLSARSSLSSPGAVTNASALPITVERIVGCQWRDLPVQPRLEALAGVVVVEADVEARRGLARDDVGCRIADVDRGDLQVRGLEPLRSLVERRRDQLVQHGDQTMRGVVGTLRVGGVTLAAPEPSARRSPSRAGRSWRCRPTARDRSARRPGRRRSARPAPTAQARSLTVPLTASRSSSPVIRRLTRPAGGPALGDEPCGSRHERGDAALHVRGTAAVKPPIARSRRRTGRRPRPRAAPGGTTSTWPEKARCRPPCPAWRADCRPGRLPPPSNRKRWQMKPSGSSAALQQVQGGPGVGRDRRAADSAWRQRDGIGWCPSVAQQLVERDLGAGALVDALDDHGAVEPGPGTAVRQAACRAECRR